MTETAQAVANDAPAHRSWEHLLPPLPYQPAALEPYMDRQTMALHHDGHHASYVANLNSILEDYPELHDRTALWLTLNLGDVPEKIRTAVRHNAGGHVNHSLFWRRPRRRACDRYRARIRERRAVQASIHFGRRSAVRVGVDLRRGDYLRAWWTIVNWEEASRRFGHLGQSAAER